MEENCVDSEFYRKQEGLPMIFLHFNIGHYSEIESILEIEEPELYERKDKDSTSNSLSSFLQETLFQIEKARSMDPDMVPDLLWKQ